MREVGNEHEILINFKAKGIHLYKSSIPIPFCIRFRYFEVEIIENKDDSAIYIGLIDAHDPFSNTLNSLDDLKAS